MSSGNSTRDVNLNTDSTITTTILVDNTGTIPVVDTPTTTLADATASDEVTTFTLVVDGTGPTLTTKTLSAGTDIALVKVGNVIRIDNAGGSGGAGAVALESQGGPPVAGPPTEYALFNGADPQAAAATIAMKKLKSTDGTVVIADDGEFLDISAVIGAGSGAITSIGDSQAGAPYASVIGWGGPPVPNLKMFVPADPRISITQDQVYIYIGSNYSLTNTIAGSATSYQLITGSGATQYCKTLAPGTGITLTSDANQVIISASAVSVNNVRVNPDATNTATSSGSTSIAIGNGATAADQSVALGAGSSSTLQSIALGTGAQCTTDVNVAVGFGAAATSTDCTVVGAGSTATAIQCTTVGTGSTASQNYTTILGTQNSTTAANCILIGNGIANTEANVLKIQSDSYRLLSAYGPNNPLGARLITSGPLWSRTGNLERYDRADFAANIATLPASAIAPGSVIFISRSALTALGHLKLPNTAAVKAMYGATVPTTPGPSWWFRIINNDGSNSCQIEKQSATPDTYIYGQSGSDSGAGFGLGQTEMVAVAAFLDMSANAGVGAMKYSVMVKFG